MSSKSTVVLSALFFAALTGCKCGAPATACTENADCSKAGKPYCGRPGMVGVCVQCQDDSNCQQGQVCADDGTCVSGCATETATCPPGTYCLPGNPACVECTKDSQCGLGLVCSTSLTCVPGCSAEKPACPPGQVCDTLTETCVACLEDSHCAPGKLCVNQVCVPGCSATHACPSGQACDPASGQCVSCVGDGDCSGATPRCDTLTHACVPCLPGPTDNCGPGAACCQGACAPLDTKVNCGGCGNACGALQACCGGSCAAVNTLTQCGACGVACGPDQFCSGVACVDRTFPNFCANKTVFAIYDTKPIDDAATDVLVSTIQANCSPSTVINYISQFNSTYVSDGGALLMGGGSTVVSAGGPFPNKPMKWLETTAKVTKVYFQSYSVPDAGGAFSFRQRTDGGIVASILESQCPPAADAGVADAGLLRDQFVIELATDPGTGTLALLGYGMCVGGYGTQAAGYQWANVILPNRAAYTDSWYIYDWYDTNRDGVANAGDTFVVLASGL